METPEVIQEWLAGQKETERVLTYPFYYNESDNSKIYCLNDPAGEKERDYWKAAFTGQKRITTEYEIWVPVKEVFKDQRKYEENKGENQEYFRYHIWCKEPEKLQSKIQKQDWELKELYIKKDMPFYTHKEEIKEITISMIRILSAMTAAACTAGYVVYLGLKTMESTGKIRLLKKMGLSVREYYLMTIRKMMSAGGLSILSGAVIFTFLHGIFLKIFDSCFYIPDYMWSRGLAGRVLLLSAAAGAVLSLTGFVVVIRISQTQNMDLQKLLKKGICFATLSLSICLLLWSCMLEFSYHNMEKELFQRKKYDAVVFFDRFLENDKAAQIMKTEGIQKAEPAVFLQVQITGRDKRKVTAVGVLEDSELWEVCDRNGIIQKPEQDGVILTEYTADRAGIENGEIFRFQAAYNQKSYEGKVRLKTTAAEQTQFEEAFSTEGFGYGNAGFLKFENNQWTCWERDQKNIQKVGQELLSKEHVAGIIYKAEEKQEYNTHTKSVRGISRILEIISFTAVFLSLKNIKEHSVFIMEKDIEILRKLGCSKKRTGEYALKKISAAFMPGIVTGILCGTLTGKFILKILSTDSFYFTPGRVFIYWIAGAFVFVLSVVWTCISLAKKTEKMRIITCK